MMKFENNFKSSAQLKLHEGLQFLFIPMMMMMIIIIIIIHHHHYNFLNSVSKYKTICNNKKTQQESRILNHNAFG